LGLKRGPGGGGGNCLSFCAWAGGLKKIAAAKNKASADSTSAGGKNFPYLINSIEPTPHAASSLLAIALTPTDGMIVGALAQIKNCAVPWCAQANNLSGNYCPEPLLPGVIAGAG
jgi:hypothetical protein